MESHGRAAERLVDERIRAALPADAFGGVSAGGKTYVLSSTVTSNLDMAVELASVFGASVIVLAAIELGLAPCPCADCRLQEAA